MLLLLISLRLEFPAYQLRHQLLAFVSDDPPVAIFFGDPVEVLQKTNPSVYHRAVSVALCNDLFFGQTAMQTVQNVHCLLQA
jgi:hypothetical protein